MTQDEINQIANIVYTKILEGNANNYDYTETIVAPATEAEQAKWSIPAVKDIGNEESKKTGNINLKKLLDAFGGDMVEQAQAAQAGAEEAKAKAEAAKNQAEAIAVGNLTGAISTVTTKNLSASRILVSDGNGKVAASAISADFLSKLEARGYMSPGFHWWLRETSALPERSVILDGSEILYALPEANDILKFVGTRYGENEDQTGFFLPDLITTADNNALGNFIRATASDSAIGTKESDAIRNISVPVTVTNLYSSVQDYNSDNNLQADDSGWYHASSTTSYGRFKINLNPYGEKNHIFYYRATFKYLSAVVNSLSFDFVLYHGTGSGYSSSAAPGVENFYSNITQFSIAEELDYSNIYANTNGEGNETDVYVKNLMVIDITDLCEAYPSFGALSISEKKAILDTLPYIEFQEEFTITHEYLESLDINLDSMCLLPVLIF